MTEEKWYAFLLSKLPDIFDIVLALLGIAIVLVGFFEGFNYKDFHFHVTDPLHRNGLIVFGVALLVVGTAHQFIHRQPSQIPKADRYGVKIIYPRENARVNTINVEGTMKELPEGYALWIFRVYSENRFYPLRECIVNKDKTWTAPGCDAGGVPGDYRAFAATLVGPDGLALISFVREANQRFGPIRKKLMDTGAKDVPYLPTVGKYTRDMVICSEIRIEPI